MSIPTKHDAQLFASVLRSHGYSVTKARQAVFAAMWHEHPMTMSELYSKVEKQLDRASLYRTIALFEELGVSRRLMMGWKYRLELSESFSHHHHHLSCQICGKVVATVEDELIESRIQSIARQHNVRITDHHLEIEGICANCQKKIKTPHEEGSS